MRNPCKRAGAVLTALAILLTLFPARMSAADSESVPTASVTFTFADSGVTASDESASGFSIDGASLTISAAGTYAVTGSCSEGNVTVAKGVTGVLLILDSLTLSCSTTAPLLCKKSTGVTLWLNGDSALTDNEDASTEDTNSDFEGAAVKVNSESASLLIKGAGSLTADASACKNGIKAGSTSSITVSGGTLNIQAANNGLAADGSVIIKGGTLNIDAENDGIKASPDDGDTESAGTITIYDGDITIDAASDGINAAGDIAIYGGSFTITAQSDGIQTDSNLTITDGDFNITTLNGYNSSGFDSDTMSCKGLKASASDDDTDDATNTVTISGGAFTLNTADDAIHSDAYIEITGGKFTIHTGDDGAHADTSLILGTDGGTVARDPDLTVNNSYEGLEAGTVYIYSGRYYVTASDDGINAAGGNSGENGGPDPGGGGGNHFNPGGGGPGGRAMSFGGFGGARLLAESSYSINILGGKVYVNADGDGLDSNGDLTLTGGEIEVWGQSSGDNEPLDYDGTLTVNGATVFAAGCAGMGVASPSNGSQTYVSYGGTSGGFGGPGGFGGGASSSASNISSGALISVTSDDATVYQANAPKAVSYVFFSSPDTASSDSISSGTGTASCQYGNDWIHTWNSGVVTTAATESASGVRTYACSVCGATETETIPQLVSIPDDADDTGDTGDTSDSGDTETDAGYAVTFVADDCIINVYYTQDYTSADEDGVTSALSRNSDTGEPDSSGDGQVNFTALPPDGYTIEESDISIEGTYKNLKGPDDTGVYSTWRITKIESDLTVTITPSKSDDSGDTGDTDDAGDTGDTGDTSDSGDTETDAGYAVIFVADDCIINVYYTQNYTVADEDGVTSALSRNSDTGEPDSSGDGQVNFTALPPDGYTIEESDISIEGTYKNLKGPDDTGVYSTWRITKIESDLTVTITPSKSDDSGDTGDTDDAGDTGDTSDTGDTGDTGDSGDTGDTGDARDSSSSGGGNSSGGSSSGGSSSGGSSSGGGCYVATAVYGSYDCPEVWTLRRFRDNVLAETWYGRLFIRLYYAVSPTAVRLFGDAEWFQNFWRDRLDKMVSELQADGFESSPYEDTVW